MNTKHYNLSNPTHLEAWTALSGLLTFDANTPGSVVDRDARTIETYVAAKTYKGQVLPLHNDEPTMVVSYIWDVDDMVDMSADDFDPANYTVYGEKLPSVIEIRYCGVEL